MKWKFVKILFECYFFLSGFTGPTLLFPSLKHQDPPAPLPPPAVASSPAVFVTPERYVLLSGLIHVRSC